MKPRNGNNTYSYPGAAASCCNEGFQPDLKESFTSLADVNYSQSSGCKDYKLKPCKCNIASRSSGADSGNVNSQLFKSENALSTAAYPQSTRRKKDAEVTKLSSTGAVAGDVYSQVFHSARAHGNCDALGATFGENQNTISENFRLGKTENGCCNEELRSNLKENLNSLAGVKCSKVSGCQNCAEVNKLRPCKCNNASSFSGAVSGDDYSQFFQSNTEDSSAALLHVIKILMEEKKDL